MKKLTETGDNEIDEIIKKFEADLPIFRRKFGANRKEENRQSIILNFYEIISKVAGKYQDDLALCRWLVTSWADADTGLQYYLDTGQDGKIRLPVDESENPKEKERVEQLIEKLDKLTELDEKINALQIKQGQSKPAKDTSYSTLWSFLKFGAVVSAVVVIGVVVAKALKDQDGPALPSGSEGAVGVLAAGTVSGLYHATKSDGVIKQFRDENSVYGERAKILEELSRFFDEAKHEFEKANENKVA